MVVVSNTVCTMITYMYQLKMFVGLCNILDMFIMLTGEFISGTSTHFNCDCAFKKCTTVDSISYQLATILSTSMF